MPTYQYECSGCGHSFEVMQSMTEPKLKRCPHCAKTKLNRLIGGGSGFIYKGGGFYETDYKQKKAAPAPACPAKDTSPGSSCACCPKNKA